MIILFVIPGGVWAALSTYLKQVETGAWHERVPSNPAPAPAYSPL